VVVFGSGDVLLAFLRRDLVGELGWLSTRQVLDAVVAGQVTPGPVFTTATFLGYLLGGVPAALVATAAIFLPSFLMVAAIEPLVGPIRRSAWAGAALDGVTMGARPDGRRHRRPRPRRDHRPAHRPGRGGGSRGRAALASQCPVASAGRRAHRG
jgi:hypothetical protein